MNFIEMKEKLQRNFAELTKDATHLFEVEIDKEEFWNLYLDSFPEGTNKIFRERREHDCSCCRQFIKNVGNAVIIKDNIITTIWDFDVDGSIYEQSFKLMSNYLKERAVTNVYFSTENKIGTDKNREQLDSGEILKWEHFYLELPNKFVNTTNKSLGDIKGACRDTRNVFKRSLDELTIDSVETILELIYSNTLYKGTEWKSVLETFLAHKKEYSKLSKSEQQNYAWEQSVKIGGAIGRIRNHSIGTLLQNISEGMELDTAVRKYEAIVAPENYKRPKEIYTKKMLEDAKKTVSELGYMEALTRRHATLDDITVNNILFSNKDSANRIGGIDIFDEMASKVPINVKQFSKVDEIGINDFINNVLPVSKEIELFLDNRHSSNMVSLIAPEELSSNTMFKWNNNFSWAYSGNLTDSSMRDRVKSAGGKVDGDLRFSIQWNDIGDDLYDLDAHCEEPVGGTHIYFGESRSRRTGGTLDVDIQRPSRKIPAVENITWGTRTNMIDGKYSFSVKDYSGRGFNYGFRAEIEFDGSIYSFDCPKVGRGERVYVADVILKNGNFTIKEKMKSTSSSKEVWNLSTNQFVPVSVIMNSPNYWDEQDGIGHKHLFFMLKNCVNEESPNGFYNEFLKEDLMKHKKVFSALGSKMAVKVVEDQLSGVGFSTTKRAEAIVKVKGQTERVMKIKF